MNIGIRNIAALGVVVSMMAMAGTAAAQVSYEPFSEVENACPDCDKPAADEITLDNGETIRGTIVAKNDDFWVVERYGEVRAIPNGKIKSTSFEDGSRPSNLESQDQIVLPNGHVLTGEIVDESDKPGHFQIESSILNVSYVVFKKKAQALYRGGSKKTIEIPEEGSDGDKSGGE